jgi:hypothetical protein
MHAVAVFPVPQNKLNVAERSVYTSINKLNAAVKSPTSDSEANGSLPDICHQLWTVVEKVCSSHDSIKTQLRKSTVTIAALQAQGPTPAPSASSAPKAAADTEPSEEFDLDTTADLDVMEQRDRLAEQNAFLHMDVANLTTQLVQLLAQSQKR